MESNITPDTNNTQVTVDVPQDRVAEFHAFFARFLAGPRGRRRGGRYGRPGRGHRGHGCAHRRQTADERETVEGREPATDVTEV
jgi:hypothetical protein